MISQLDITYYKDGQGLEKIWIDNSGQIMIKEPENGVISAEDLARMFGATKITFFGPKSQAIIKSINKTKIKLKHLPNKTIDLAAYEVLNPKEIKVSSYYYKNSTNISQLDIIYHPNGQGPEKLWIDDLGQILKFKPKDGLPSAEDIKRMLQ